MRIEIHAFTLGKEITFNVKHLEQFMDEIRKLPDLYEYDLIYQADQVTVKRKM